MECHLDLGGFAVHSFQVANLFAFPLLAPSVWSQGQTVVQHRRLSQFVLLLLVDCTTVLPVFIHSWTSASGLGWSFL